MEGRAFPKGTALRRFEVKDPRSTRVGVILATYARAQDLPRKDAV